MVDTPKKFSIDRSQAFSVGHAPAFIECSGNGLTEWNKPTLKTVQGTHGLLSTSEWTGVQFSTIAREIGLKPGSAWVLAEGADTAVMTRSVPIEKMLNDGFIAYGQNGEALRPEQGYPLRLVLPGWEGNTHDQMAAPSGDLGQAVHDARGDLEIHRSLKDGTARQFVHHGGEVRHHLPIR